MYVHLYLRTLSGPQKENRSGIDESQIEWQKAHWEVDRVEVWVGGGVAWSFASDQMVEGRRQYVRAELYGA